MDKQPVEPWIRAQAVALHQSDPNLSKISEQLQGSRYCMRNKVTKFEKYDKFNDMKRSGRPEGLSDRNIRELKRLVQDDNRLSAAKGTTDLNMSLSKPVFKRTVRRCLKKLNYEYPVTIKK